MELFRLFPVSRKSCLRGRSSYAENPALCVTLTNALVKYGAQAHFPIIFPSSVTQSTELNK